MKSMLLVFIITILFNGLTFSSAELQNNSLPSVMGVTQTLSKSELQSKQSTQYINQEDKQDNKKNSDQVLNANTAAASSGPFLKINEKFEIEGWSEFEKALALALQDDEKNSTQASNASAAAASSNI